MAEISGAALQRVRLVPMSEHAPVGPVTAPPDQFIEHTGFNMLTAELLEFARCINTRQPYPVAIEEVLHGMAVFDAAKQSAKTGGIVAVSDR
jgi:predicted dehydrogenase